MKTFQPKKEAVTRSWHTLDARGEVLGRLASKAAGLLMGKGKINYAPHVDMGDFVVVVNVADITLTGKKAKEKKYFSHSGYPKGFKETSITKLKADNPERIIELAVKGMLPDNRLKAKRMARLKLVKGEKNPYAKES